MILTFAVKDKDGNSSTRASGDDPEDGTRKDDLPEFYPRKRG